MFVVAADTAASGCSPADSGEVEGGAFLRLGKENVDDDSLVGLFRKVLLRLRTPLDPFDFLPSSDDFFDPTVAAKLRRFIMVGRCASFFS